MKTLILLSSGIRCQVDRALEAKRECPVFLGRRQTHDGGSCYFLMFVFPSQLPGIYTVSSVNG